jgi:hypothetical protein
LAYHFDNLQWTVKATRTGADKDTSDY